MRYCGRQNNGKALLLTDDEIINNALEQEKSGIKPHYAFYDYKNHEKMTPAISFIYKAFRSYIINLMYLIYRCFYTALRLYILHSVRASGK